MSDAGDMGPLAFCGLEACDAPGLLEAPARVAEVDPVFADVSPASIQQPALPGAGDRRQGRLTPEFSDYISFVEDLFVLWLRGARPGNELWVWPEMGMSHGYNLSGDPPVWLDVIRCRKEILGAWARAIGRTG